MVEVDSIKENLSRIRGIESGDQLHESAFARPVFANYGDDSPGLIDRVISLRTFRVVPG